MVTGCGSIILADATVHGRAGHPGPVSHYTLYTGTKLPQIKTSETYWTYRMTRRRATTSSPAHHSRRYSHCLRPAVLDRQHHKLHPRPITREQTRQPRETTRSSVCGRRSVMCPSTASGPWSVTVSSKGGAARRQPDYRRTTPTVPCCIQHYCGRGLTRQVST